MITLDGVTKSYSTSNRSALDDVSVHIDRGGFVFLIGPPGSGKSTFLRLMVHEEKVDSGKLTVASQDLTKISRHDIPKLRQEVGYVFRDLHLLPRKTVYENVTSALQVIGRSKTKIGKAVPETLEMVRLSGKENRYPYELLGGGQQRVIIAHAFANRPPILFADKPAGNLNPSTFDGIMLLFDRTDRIGTTIIVLTYDNNAIDSMRHHMLELGLGRLVRDDATGVYDLSNQQAVYRQKSSFERYC